jgi:citrate synthase
MPRHDIHDMAQKASFEEVAYLLLNGELPNGKQLVEFAQQIAAERALPVPVIEMLRLLPRKTHPMDMLRTGVSMLSAFDKDLSDNSHDADIRKSIRLIARVSTLLPTAGASPMETNRCQRSLISLKPAISFIS